jgi:hypothetical protein
MITDVVVIGGADVKAEAMTWPERARALVIRDTASYLHAVEELFGIKSLRQKIAKTFDSHIKAAFDAHRGLIREKLDAESSLIEAEGIINGGLVAFDNAQEVLRRDEERRRHDDALKQEEERRITEAAALETEAHANGDSELLEQAHELLAQPIVTPAIAPVERSTPKVQDLWYREGWKFRVVNDAKIPREYLLRDDVKIGGVVRAMKGATNIPGIEVYVEKVVATRKR